MENYTKHTYGLTINNRDIIKGLQCEVQGAEEKKSSLLLSFHVFKSQWLAKADTRQDSPQFLHQG